MGHPRRSARPIESMLVSLQFAAGSLPPVSGGKAPKIVAHLSALLSGSELRDLETYQKLEGGLPAELSSANAWLRLAVQITGALKWADHLEQDPPCRRNRS